MSGRHRKIGVKKETRRNEGSEKGKQTMSMKERGARIEMGTEGRIDIQRLWKGNRYLREKSRNRKRGRGVWRGLLKKTVVRDKSGWS